MNITERLEIQRAARIASNIQASRVPLYTRQSRRLSRIKRADENGAALDAVAAFLENRIEPPILLLIGTPGVGKTTLAYAIAWEYLEDGLSVQYWQTEELLNELQAALEDGKEFGRIWVRLRSADLLILDDLDNHNPTKWREGQLDALVDFRYREMVPLVLAANQVELSDRITDRIKEGRTALISGRSWRGRGLI